jgi:D-aminopeptidase
MTPITPGTSTGMTTEALFTSRVSGVVSSGLVASTVGCDKSSPPLPSAATTVTSPSPCPRLREPEYAVAVRASELGITIGSTEAGPRNAITDVEGVLVGHSTLIEGDDVRTGVTVIVPPETPLFAGCHRLNGNGELTGLEWVRESGLLTTPIGVTNTFSVGVVRDAIAARSSEEDAWSLPVVGETFDGFLNDIRAQRVTAQHVHAAFDAASVDVAEGNVGGGTGMICHEFKGGIGTASRLVNSHVVGVLVQANYGRRARFRVDGVPVGELIGERIPTPQPRQEWGSIIGVVATDAPLLPHQCSRLAQRMGLGVARVGGTAAHTSGDLFFAFATGNRGLGATVGETSLRMLSDGEITPLYAAVIDATEEAILNALLAAETMSGRDGHTVHALEPDLLLDALRRA